MDRRTKEKGIECKNIGGGWTVPMLLPQEWPELYGFVCLYSTLLPQAGRQLELCWRTSREFHPSEDLSKLRTGVSLWADGIMAGTACQGCLGLSGYRSAPYLAVL